MNTSITYKYRNEEGKGRNKWKIALIFGYWPARIEKQRGYSSAQYITSRPMDDIEKKEHAKRFRCYSVHYTSFHKLLEDEKNILGDDHPFIKELDEKFRDIARW